MLRKITLLSCAAMLAAGLSVAATSAHAATPKVDMSQDTIQCNSLLGVVATVKPRLTNASGVPLAISIKGKLDGCTVSGPNPATILTSSFAGKLTATSSGCAGLLSATPLSGTVTISWKADKTTPLLQTKSVITAQTLTGGIFNGPAGDAHGQFTLDASGATGAFLGNDAGASSQTIAATSQDVGLLAGQCGGAGIKTINLGLGQLNVG